MCSIVPGEILRLGVMEIDQNAHKEPLARCLEVREAEFAVRQNPFSVCVSVCVLVGV